MGIINVLPKNVAELIAAGEVIERPASVIKELVENSIDAGATAVTVEIQCGGRTFMRVTDNGCGIENADVRNAFLRHATSKISVSDDLDAIDTLGFRGEALASICAVSRVEILTKNTNEQIGTRYAIDGGEETAFEAAGCPQGTTFIVRDLFYNVPARMKFLKKDVSEGNNIANLIDRMALSHPEISFALIRDGKQTLRTQGDGRLDNAVYQVFGRQFSDSLIPVDYEYDNISVRGFVTKPAASVKANRSMQMFYINGRYIRTKTGMAALEQAYRGSIMTGKFPSCVLLITMNCSMLDVNVHPAKLEVRFTNERPVYESVYHAVRSAVMNYDTRNEVPDDHSVTMPKPELLNRPADRGIQLSFSSPQRSISNLPDALANRPSAAKADSDVPVYSPEKPPVVADSGCSERPVNSRSSSFDIMALLDDDPSPVSVPAIPQAQPESRSETQKPSRGTTVFSEERSSQNAAQTADGAEADSYEDEQQPELIDEQEQPKALKFVGEAFNTYIIIEYDNDRLMFIDKHAAHERLLYEKIKASGAGMNPQYLLEPVIVSLDKEACRIVLENREMLLEAGFEVDGFGDSSVIIRSVPVFMEKLDTAEEFEEIADYLVRHKKVILSEKMDWIIANTACRAAIKGGNISTPEELMELAVTLEENPQLRTCPHGRPVYFFMSRREIEKNFKRIV